MAAIGKAPSQSSLLARPRSCRGLSRRRSSLARPSTCLAGEKAKLGRVWPRTCCGTPGVLPGRQGHRFTHDAGLPRAPRSQAHRALHARCWASVRGAVAIPSRYPLRKVSQQETPPRRRLAISIAGRWIDGYA